MTHPRTTLAASFIVTVSTTFGCAPVQPTAQLTHNPPQPVPTATIATSDGAPAPDPISPETDPDTAPPEGELRDVPDRPGRVTRDGDTCTWMATYEPAPCPADAQCNPPPPEMFAVTCPALPDAPVGATVQKRADGTCFYRERHVSGCKPGVRCNPPPPRRHDVRCPHGI